MPLNSLFSQPFGSCLHCPKLSLRDNYCGFFSNLIIGSLRSSSDLTRSLSESTSFFSSVISVDMSFESVGAAPIENNRITRTQVVAKVTKIFFMILPFTLLYKYTLFYPWNKTKNIDTKIHLQVFTCDCHLYLRFPNCAWTEIWYNNHRKKYKYDEENNYPKSVDGYNAGDNG